MKNKVEYKKISSFIPDPKNANLGSERGLRDLDNSLSETGLGRSIVTDKNGVVIGGNKTTERSIDRGFDDAIVVHTDGKQLVVVQRDDLDLSDTDPNNPARRMAYWDNITSLHSLNWDANVIAADVEAGVDLSGMFYDWEVDTIMGNAHDMTDREALWQGMPEFEQEAINAFKVIKVVFETEQDMKDFALFVNQTVTDKTKTIYYPKKDKREIGKYVDGEP